MFGPRFFGATHFGPRYFGPSGTTVVPVEWVAMVNEQAKQPGLSGHSLARPCLFQAQSKTSGMAGHSVRTT